MSRPILASVRDILSRATVTGDGVQLPARLDRDQYEAVNIADNRLVASHTNQNGPGVAARAVPFGAYEDAEFGALTRRHI